ncbi:putative uncharacterized protein DDB_G0282133 [Condylostylus longicornis]|uniref:putative uncharacterized protein DDB_G0282133 n=1 Tax=Condylostylus longicornis TaxID=2530218 RepID=UPI00244DD9FD|nr:putative uncharacterized protein DDB_G0282133 [Condylostylus longicornis]
MSEQFEESPVSDNMDISTTTTIESQESEEGTNSNYQQTTPTNSSIISLKNSCSNNSSNMNNTENLTFLTEGNKNKINGMQTLDNDPNTRNLKANHQKLSQSSQRSEAVNHPLMPLSPTGTDSDSEHGHYRRSFNYPDVVPQTEQPLRLSLPKLSSKNCSNNKHNNFNSINTGGNINEKVINANIDATSKIQNNINRNTTPMEARKVLKSQNQLKINILRAPSPDLLSSGESEQEISQYQASVESNFQAVALIANNIPVSRSVSGTVRELYSPNQRSNLAIPHRKKVPASSEVLSDDISSLDSISNHSFDDGIEPNLASLSPTSSLMDDDFGGDIHEDFDDDFGDLETPTNQQPVEPIPQYSAEEERRDSRLWQKITLPDGKVREIDMKVIEPYKRVLSHGGYLKAGGHNAIVMFCACHLPDKSRADYHYVMDNLFLYVIKTLEQLVTEDYVLVYLHGGSSRRNVPPFPWLKKCYQLLDRRLRKSLKNLYLVHPTFWLKSVVWMTRPFVSSKFWRKLIYVRTLEELYSMVSVEKTAIPDKVKTYDAKYK